MRGIRSVFCFVSMFVLTMAVAGLGHATPPEAPKQIEAVMIGDRVVDIALALGFIPQGMSVRASMWSKGYAMRNGVQILGCPNYVTKKNKDAVGTFMKERGLTRLIIERSAQFCIYMKDVNPINVAPLVQNIPGVTIEYVDFSQGVAAAIRQTAMLLGVEEKGEQVVKEYEEAMRKVEEALPEEKLGRRVLILNGVYFADRGKPFLRVEAPGGYSDQYILEPLGCVNAATDLLNDNTGIMKGHFNAGSLSNLDKANPDVIVATGDPFAVQLALHRILVKKPELASVPAIKNLEIYALPFYCDSDILEYPDIFTQWRVTLEP